VQHCTAPHSCTNASRLIRPRLSDPPRWVILHTDCRCPSLLLDRRLNLHHALAMLVWPGTGLAHAPQVRGCRAAIRAIAVLRRDTRPDKPRPTRAMPAMQPDWPARPAIASWESGGDQR
jgi:hypothetical protein